ncbi:hypothetical protein V3C99_012539, partial [Haemonchus contortus]
RGSGLPLQETEDQTPAQWSVFFTKALNDRTALLCLFLKRGRFTEPLLLATGTNGEVTGALYHPSSRSRKVMV